MQLVQAVQITPVIQILLMAIAGAGLYRWRGIGHKWKKYTPRPLPQLAFSVPYTLVVLDQGYWAAGLVLVLTTLAVASGHGAFFDLGKTKTEVEDERLEFLIKPLYKKIPEFWYDVLGLIVTGLAVTLPAGIILQNPYIAMSGALKALAYAIGGDTDQGEYITGFFLWGSLAALILVSV